MISQDFMFSGVVEGLCRQAGFAPQVAFESSQWDLLYEMALDGRGRSFLPESAYGQASPVRGRMLASAGPCRPLDTVGGVSKGAVSIDPYAALFGAMQTMSSENGLGIEAVFLLHKFKL